MVLFTLGYERRDLDEVVTVLADAGVAVLVDVRQTPRSRKPGLSKTRLGAALARAGVEYRHEPRLGVPREDRDAFRADGPDAVGRYRDRLATTDHAALARVASLARTRATALLCFERDEQCCHRRIVAELVRDLDPRIEHVALP